MSKYQSKYQRTRGFSGLSKLRKTMKRMEPGIKAGVSKQLERAATRIEADAIGWAYLQDIRDTGEMINSISWKLGPDKLTVIIGPGADKGAWRGVAFNTSSTRFAKLSIKQKDANWNFMKGYWAEFGTQGPVPQEPRSFMNRAWEENRARVKGHIDRAVGDALRKAAL